MSQPKIVLHYFPFYGRGGCVREALKYGAVAFDDVNVQFEDWPAMKASGSTPFDSLPFMTADGKVLGQSNACLAFAGRLSGLYPVDPHQASVVDSVMSFVESNCMPSMNQSFASEDDKKAFRLDFATGAGVGKLPWALGKLQHIIESNESLSGWFVGPTMTVADLKVRMLVKVIEDNTMDYITTDHVTAPIKVPPAQLTPRAPHFHPHLTSLLFCMRACLQPSH